MRASPLAVAFVVTLGLSACQCGGPSLIRTGGDGPDGGHGTGGTGGSASGGGTGGSGGGSATGGGSGGGATGGGTGGAGWCASDCDCGTGERCVAGTGELVGNSCQPGGTNTCATPCGGVCGAGLQCVNGSCQVTPCVGTNCTSGAAISVQGTYFTYYELDISQFANRASDVAKLLDLLSAALNGNAMCGSQTTPEGQLICIVVSLIAQNIHAPPWVAQLINVLADAFRFGNTPIKAKGVMQLAENPNLQLFASERWTEMWLDYNGQVMNVMNNPALGANGNISVTVLAFGGTRSPSEVFLGPRSIEFDVNRLLVNLINVAISAASNGRAHDVGELIDLILCSNVPITDPNYVVCTAAASQFAQNFQLPIGLGGIDITQQRATIYDLDNDGVADALGLPNARGSVTGSMTNGLVSGDLGAFPNSNWYGTK